MFLVGLSSTTTDDALAGSARSATNPRPAPSCSTSCARWSPSAARSALRLPDDYAEQRLAFADGVSPDMTSSMHHDLERGNRLEVDWLSGAVVDLGAKAGVPAPLCRAVRDIMLLHAGGAKS